MKQRGFTLLEVMVAMLIVSIGLVGLAGLLITGSKNNQSAYHRSQASWMAYDILDRMRANRTLAQNGTYNLTVGATPTVTGTALTDLTQWTTQIANALPDGRGGVNVNATLGIIEVTVRWNDSRGLGLAPTGFVGNVAQSVMLRTKL